MTTVSNTFICPSCSSGLNVKEGQKPDVCTNCGYRFGAQPVVYRLPKPLIQQFRERLAQRIATIPPMPSNLDIAEVHQKDAKLRYKEAQEARAKKDEQEILRSTIINMPETYARDTIDSFVRMVIHASQLTPAVRAYLESVLPFCADTIANIQKGYQLGVDYGVENARPVPSATDILDSGARGVPTAPECNPSGTVGK
jgi:hypothetical protein